MRLLLYFFFLAVICSCSEPQKKSQSVNELATEESSNLALDPTEVILERVKEIYFSNNHTAFSSSFNELIEKVKKYDDGADIGYLDHDILTQAQDDIIVKGIKIENITQTTCTANIETDNNQLVVKLVKENSVWLIDDVNDERNSMNKYLEN